MASINRRLKQIGIGLLNLGALSLSLTSLSNAARAQDVASIQHSPVHASGKTEALLYTVVFKTPQGRIRVVLPADMRPGDALIGTASLEPSGRKETQQEANRGQLSAYTLSLAGQSHSCQEPALRWTLPDDFQAKDAVLVLMDPGQKEAAHAELPLHEKGSGPAATTPEGDRIQLPTKGQSGRPLVFNQPIPGGPDDLHILVGEKEAHLLAASPRVYVVESPRDVQGKTTLQVKRGSELLAEGKFSNRRVSGGNPWPYVVVVLVGIGIYIAVQAIQFQHDLNNIRFVTPFF